MNSDVNFRRVEGESQSVDPSHVPSELSEMLPFAERFRPYLCGGFDQFVRSLSKRERQELDDAVVRHSAALADWLDRSCELGPPYPSGHALLSGLRMYVEMYGIDGR